MLRDSLIQFLSTRIEEWPEWLPVIVHDLGDVDSKRSWNEQQDVGVILQSGIVLDSEVESLKMMVEEENYQIVQLWNRVSGFPLSEEVRNRFDKISGKSDEFANNDLRRIILEFMFEKPGVFDNSVIKGHVDDFPQKTQRYPVLAERTDVENKPLVMIPEPSKHWKYSRVNIMKEGGKIWFPTHMSMRGDRVSAETIPPRYREAYGSSDNVQNSYGYLPNDISSPLTMQRGEEEGLLPGPNVIHWGHDFHPDNLTEALELSIEYLRESEFVPNRPEISLSGNPDLVFGNLRILAAGEEVKEMIANEDAFKLPSLLNTAYMPIDCLIKSGKEDGDGNTRKIYDYTVDPYCPKKDRYSFHPTTWVHELQEGMETWSKHLFNWNLDDDAPREERGSSTGDVWKARIDDEGDDEKFNYSILVRDLRVDHILLEMAMGNPNLMGLALEINCSGQSNNSRIRGGLWIFEGYWSKTDSRQMNRELRFDIIHQSYNPNLMEYRYVNSEPRVTVDHSSFAPWKDRKLLGFSKESSQKNLELGERGVLDLLPDNWIPCNQPTDEYKKLLEAINISVIEVDVETFAWSFGVEVPPSATNPWRKRLQDLCKEAKKAQVADQKELLKQIDKIARQVNGLENIIKTGLSKIDQAIIDEFSELAKICSGIGSTLPVAIQSVQMSHNSMKLDDIEKVFQGVNLCNWKYADGKFIASDETGLTNRHFIVATPDEAEQLFGWRGDRFSASDGEWNSKGFGLKDGVEMVIFDTQIAKLIEEANNISRIEMPNMELLRKVKLESDSAKFQFIGSILTLDYFKDQSLLPAITPDSMVNSLQSREECSLIDSGVAKQNHGVTLRDDLTIGPGGWEVIPHNNEYLLVHGQMPDLLWSLGLLKELMRDCGVPDDVLNFSTGDIKSYQRKIECQKLIAGKPFKEDFVDALLGKNTEESFLVESLNPWSTVQEEHESYRTRFTLDAPRDELLRERLLWEKSDGAKKHLKNLQDNYKQGLESGNLWTTQNRALLEVMYSGRICILDGKQYLSSDSDDTADFDYPRFRTTISSGMIGGHAIVQDAIDKIRQPDLIGDTLITSADAREKLGRTADSKRLDLIEGFYEKMRDVVHSDHWDIAGDWVLTDSVLISPSNDMLGLWLHKLHHLHITALYSALSELGN